MFSFKKDETPITAEASEAEGELPPQGLLVRLRSSLGRTRGALGEGLSRLVLGKRQIDAALLEEIETQLLSADLGVEATQAIIEDLTARVARRQLSDANALFAALREDLLAILEPCSRPLQIGSERPFVILMVGINGAGKTTSIGKLAKLLHGQGHTVLLAAGDTFRAAAIEQLQVWGERNAIAVIAQHSAVQGRSSVAGGRKPGATGADSASVIYDALQAAKARGADVLIADTAGRLHTQGNLMEELKKVKRVIAKADPGAPHEVLLVLDAGTGQNALNQAEQFQLAVGVTGIILTKLDGTARGGVIFAIAKKLGLPIRYIGVGEAIEDLREFNAREFVEALFDEQQ